MKLVLVKLVVIVLVYTMCFGVTAQEVNQRPKLVVGIVVDQMRNEYINRYYDDFGEDGIKRLINKGYYFTNTHYEYMPTYTAPGHATIYTGAVPNVHGIVGNSWYHRGLQQVIYCTQDDSCDVVGGEGRGMSSARLASSTVTDELRMSTNERGKVIGVSIKDRGAILPAGHMSNGAYWFDDDGNFISSSYFMESLPKWVQKFNNKKLPIEYIKKGWDMTPGVTFDESLKDDNPYESKLGGKTAPVFPYDLTDLIKSGGIGSMRATPYGNDLVVDFVEEALVQEQLGKDEHVDMIAVSFSSTDYVGHAMGPRAIETQDTYIRLDRSIARLLQFLDKEVGNGNYLVFLTADHGAAEVPNYLRDRGFDVSTISYSALSDELKKASIKEYGENVVKNVSNFNIHLNHEVLKNLKLDEKDVVEFVRSYLLNKDYVRRVYDQDEILRGNPADHYLSLLFNGYDPKQGGELVMILKPGFMSYKQTGTTHGSPYAYDTHVPLIWYGWGIPHGRAYGKKFVTQIAPTLSQKINIGLPNGTQAEILTELFEK